MSWRDYLILFLIGFLMALSVSFFQPAPGYMDADYYYAGGIRLAQGYGFSEQFLWNYLDDPVGLPHPSHAYWMPLPSILAAAGMFLTRIYRFDTARIGFLILAGIVPVLSAALSFSITNRKDLAWLAGILAGIPGFYLSYLATTDAFGIYMILGASWLLVIGPTRISGTVGQAVLLGLISGLMHLTRADGFIWFLLALLGIYLILALPANRLPLQNRSFVTRKVLTMTSACFLGYFLVMGPWMARNYLAYGTLLAPGGMHSLWLTNYDELYAYPASILTPGHWLASGIQHIVADRLQALGQNLQTAGAVQGEIFLTPLILLGLWQYRKDIRIYLGISGWITTFLVMTFIFPYAGWRGGFFHSGTSVQSMFWAVAPVGLLLFVDWGGRVRRWNVRQAGAVFSVALVCLAVMLSVLVVRNRVVGNDLFHPVWGQSQEVYVNLERDLQELGVDQNEIVMVNNAPGYYVASGRQAISIPTGGLPAIFQVAHRYKADYLLLEKLQGLTDVYTSPANQPGLEYLATSQDVLIFHIDR